MTKHPPSKSLAMALLCYCPVCCLLVSLISVYINRTGPSYVAGLFQGGFLRNALPLPGYPGFIQLPGLILGFCTFVVASLLRNSNRPFIGVVQIRVFVVILIWLITFPINTVVISETRAAGFQAWIQLIMIAVHLNIAFIATFLPLPRPGGSLFGWIDSRSARNAG